MPAFDLSLGLRMERCTTHMAHLLRLDIFGQFTRDVAGAIIAEQPGLVQHCGAVAARGLQGHIQRVGDILGPHVGAELPGDDVAREVVEYCRQIHPSPSDDFEVGKIGLPHLVGAGGFGVELIRRFHHDIGRAGDQVMRLQQPVNRGFRYEVTPLIGKPHGQFPGRQL